MNDPHVLELAGEVHRLELLAVALLVAHLLGCSLLVWAIVLGRAVLSKWLEANARLVGIWQANEEAARALSRAAALVMTRVVEEEKRATESRTEEGRERGAGCA